MVDFVRLLLGLGYSDGSSMVFDGQVGHAVELRGYDFEKNAFVYWDPWGEGSFLEKSNNAAGVAAWPHPTEQRLWMISFDDLERVLYEVTVRLNTLSEVFRLCTLAADTPQNMTRTYLSLAKGDEGDGLNATTLESFARYLFRAGRPEAAVALLAAKVSIDSTSSSQDLMELARQHGIGDLNNQASNLLRIASASPDKVLGQQLTLQDALSSDFFQFFKFEKISVENNTTTFRPPGQSRALVEVRLTTNSEGYVVNRQMAIKHSFIHDRRNWMFAADFTSSFVRFAVGPADMPVVQGVADEILKIYLRRSAKIPGAVRQTASVPAIPSLAALTYLGARPKYEMTLPTSVLTLSNAGEPNNDELVVTAIPR
jgi:hypothetical protein